MWPLPFKPLALRTHIITPDDDLVEVVRRYTRDVADPGDVVALSESMVAIAQGRAVLPDSVRPRPLARLLRRFAHPDGSLATPAAMELAIREAGAPRILLAGAAAAVARLFGVRGVFYRVAGHGLQFIDDIGGTLPPFDRYIVLGPRDARRVAETVKAAIGVDVAIVDVNDLGCVDIIAYTGSDDPGPLAEALRPNPQGNDDEQTPIVVLKRMPSDERVSAPRAGRSP